MRTPTKLTSGAEESLPAGTTVALRGQVRTMSESFTRLGIH